MPESAIHHEIYHIGDGDIPVTWQSFDFSAGVANIPNENIRAVMLDSGVMYVASATPKIRVSTLLDLDLQGLSAAHEELCMERKVDKCSAIEQMVIDAITDPALRTRFINTRLRMFGALCMLDSTNQEFAASHQLLTARASKG